MDFGFGKKIYKRKPKSTISKQPGNKSVKSARKLKRSLPLINKNSVIDLLNESAPQEQGDDDIVKINEVVESKVKDFFRSPYLISSDEEDLDLSKIEKKNSVSTPTSSNIISLDNSDVMNSQPGTSTSNSFLSSNSLISDNFTEVISLSNEILSAQEEKLPNLSNIKRLEDFRKETENMLQNAKSLIQHCGKEVTEKEVEPEKPKESPVKPGAHNCPICLENLLSKPAVCTICGHIFCKECILVIVKTQKTCPTCRKAINNKKYHPIYL